MPTNELSTETRPYQVIRESDGKILYDGNTPESDAEIMSTPTPVLVQVDRARCGNGSYSLQIKDPGQDTWRTIRQFD